MRKFRFSSLILPWLLLLLYGTQIMVNDAYATCDCPPDPASPNCGGGGSGGTSGPSVCVIGDEPEGTCSIGSIASGPWVANEQWFYFAGDGDTYRITVGEITPTSEEYFPINKDLTFGVTSDPEDNDAKVLCALKEQWIYTSTTCSEMLVQYYMEVSRQDPFSDGTLELAWSHPTANTIGASTTVTFNTAGPKTITAKAQEKAPAATEADTDSSTTSTKAIKIFDAHLQRFDPPNKLIRAGSYSCLADDSSTALTLKSLYSYPLMPSSILAYMSCRVTRIQSDGYAPGQGFFSGSTLLGLWTYHAFSEPSSEKHPQPVTVFARLYYGDHPISNEYQFTVMSIFNYLKHPTIARYQDAVDYICCKYGVSAPGTVTYNPNLTDRAGNTDPFGNMSVGDSAFDSENVLASTIGHEVVHTNQPIWERFHPKECVRESSPYQWEVNNSNITGVDQQYLNDIAQYLSKICAP